MSTSNRYHINKGSQFFTIHDTSLESGEFFSQHKSMASAVKAAKTYNNITGGKNGLYRVISLQELQALPTPQAQ